MVHSVVAVLFIALNLGHIYTGTLGTEDAFEAMWTGNVDINWAKEHHDLWLEDTLAKSEAGAGLAAAVASAGRNTSPRGAHQGFDLDRR